MKYKYELLNGACAMKLKLQISLAASRLGRIVLHVAAIAKKAANILFLNGLKISGDKTEIARLAEYVLTFGNCIKTLAGWKKACELAGCKYHATNLTLPVA